MRARWGTRPGGKIGLFVWMIPRPVVLVWGSFIGVVLFCLFTVFHNIVAIKKSDHVRDNVLTVVEI